MIRGKYLTVAVCALMLGSTSLLSAREEWRFTLRPEESRFTVAVGRAGFFKVFGHDHLIEIRGFRGDVSWEPDAPERTSIRIDVDAGSLTVVNEDDEEERAQIQAAMESKALDVEHHPLIAFVSEAVSLENSSSDGYHGRIRGQLTLRGITKAVTIPLTLSVDGESLRARGEFQIKGSDFGIRPITAGGGTVKTSDDLKLTFDLVGERE